MLFGLCVDFFVSLCWQSPLLSGDGHNVAVVLHIQSRERRKKIFTVHVMKRKPQIKIQFLSVVIVIVG